MLLLPPPSTLTSSQALQQDLLKDSSNYDDTYTYQGTISIDFRKGCWCLSGELSLVFTYSNVASEGLSQDLV